MPKQPKGSIYDRWDSEIPEQFKTVETDKETLKEVEELRRKLENQKIRDFVNGK